MKAVAIVAMIGNVNNGATRGVAEKVIAQSIALKKIGYDVRGFVGIWGDNNEIDFPEHISKIELDEVTFSLNRKRFFLNEVFNRLAGEGVDLVYLRYPLADFSVLEFLSKIQDRYPHSKVVLERQTKELRELLTRKTISNLIKYLLEFAIRIPVQKKADLNVCVTSEIGRYVQRYYPKAKCITIGNGISGDIITKVREQKSTCNDNIIRLVFVGNLTPWCGIDWAIQQLVKRRFSHCGQNVVLSVIGDGVFAAKLKKESFGFEKNVKFFGHLSGDSLTEEILKNDIAIGSFSNGLRGLNEGSNLKLRLYCALGIPFVFSDRDADFPSDGSVSSFYRCLYDQNVKPDEFIDILLDFAMKMNLEPSAQIQLTTYARESLVWEMKFQRLDHEISKI